MSQALAGDCLQGTGAAAVTQVATSKSSVTQGGAMGFTVNTAEGNATTDVTMMDMNGDGYPDIVAGGVVQYTNSQGGISGEKSQELEKISSENSSSSKGYGGNPVASVSSIVKLIKHSPQTAANSQTKWQAQFSLSGSGSYNKDEAAVQFIDMNGDGLPDQILKNKQVRINLGYTFSDPMDSGTGTHSGW